MFNFIKRHKVASLLVCVNVVAILVVILVIVIHNTKSAVVDIYVAPSAATIELNGKKYDNFVSYDMFPGDYHVKIAMDGMQSKEYDLYLGDGDFGRLWDYLKDENGSLNYYVRNADEEAILAKVANDDESKKFVQEYEKAAGILKDLPIEYDGYSDDFAYYTKYSIDLDERDDCPKMICLAIVDNTGGNEQAALAKIREMGYEPGDYEISYNYVPLYMSEINR